MREIIEAIKLWIIHLFDIHCSDCNDNEEDKLICKNCNYLISLLEQERHEREKLLGIILNGSIVSKFDEKLINEKEEKEEKISTSKFIPWHIRRGRMEEEDRKNVLKNSKDYEAEFKRDKSLKTTEELEKELLEN